MTDIPIIFSAPMAQALLASRKTQTRRLAWRKATARAANPDSVHPTPWRKVSPGDRLWVRETYYHYGIWREVEDDGWHFFPGMPADGVWYQFDDGQVMPKLPRSTRGFHKRPSIYMPRPASRLTLVVTATKIEPLQCIAEGDARAEGIICHEADETDDAEFAYEKGGMIFATAAEAYEALWRALHGADSWKASPEVVALTFDVHKANIDALKVAA